MTTRGGSRGQIAKRLEITAVCPTQGQLATRFEEHDLMSKPLAAMSDLELQTLLLRSVTFVIGEATQLDDAAVHVPDR